MNFKYMVVLASGVTVTIENATEWRIEGGALAFYRCEMPDNCFARYLVVAYAPGHWRELREEAAE